MKLRPGRRALIAALNLAEKDLSGLRARLILVHGLDDDVIRYSESVALVNALPPEQTRLFLLNGLFHVVTDARVVDGWQLWRAIDALLAERAH